MADPLVAALPEADQAEIERVCPIVFTDAASVGGSLESLVEKHPHIPTLWNWLMTSVMASGEKEAAVKMSEEIHRRFPGYLFGVAQWVMILLREERFDEATRVLDGRLGLAAWWPERRVYHSTEFVVFNSMLGMYFLNMGNRKAAGLQLTMIHDILPDHPAVLALEAAIVREAVRLMREELEAIRASVGPGPGLGTIQTRSAQVLRLAGGV